MWPYRHAGAGRREFGRVVLATLAATARAELDTHRARGRRLRARRAERRLAELEEALERLELGAPPVGRSWQTSAGVEAAAALVCVASAAALGVAVALQGTEGVVVRILDVAMLLATLAWFSAAIGRRARVRHAPAHAPNGGSSPADAGR
jgi:hypothetical protein